MTKTLAALAAALLASTAVLAEDFDSNQTITNVQIVHGWRGAAYSNPEGTRWSHCAASSRQVGRNNRPSFVSVKIHASGTMELLVSSIDWKMTPGKTYRIGIQVDDAEILRTEASALDASTLVVGFIEEAKAQSLVSLAGAGRLFIYRGDEVLIGYTMQNSAKALAWLDTCVRNGSAMNGVDFDAESDKPTVNPKTPKLDS